MRTLYNILAVIVTACKAPFDLVRIRRRGNWRVAFRQRYGLYDSKLKQALTNRDAIWMHATSTEDVNLCTQIIRVLEPRIPNVKIVVSTRTVAGMAELARKLPTHVSKIYYPMDRRSCVSRALSTIRPMVIVLVEPELRPNFIWRAREMEMPVFVVNPRIPKAVRDRYERFGFLFRRLFASLAGVCARDEHDAARLRALGCRSQAVLVTGELPYEPARLEERRLLDVPTILRQIGLDPDALLLVAGGTCEGEEELLLDLFLRLKARFPNLFLVLAPRRFERCREIGGMLRSRRMKFLYRNEITPTTRLEPGSVECLLVNTSGETRLFYQRASIIFVGSSFAGDGSQDPIEPGSAAKAMVFGAKAGRFAELTRAFVQEEAAVLVRNPQEMDKALVELLEDEPRRLQMGRNAVKVVHQNLGPVDLTVEMILKHLADEELYFAPARGE